MKKNALIQTVAGVCLLTSGALAGLYYVAPSGSDQSSGTGSWTNAKKTIGSAMTMAIAYDTLWVARGTYSENCTLKSSVRMFGGFAVGGTSVASRDWKTNRTIIDGKKTGGVIFVNDRALPTTGIDGFVLRNGSSMQGSGIRCGKFAFPVIANVTIENCYASVSGGGIFADSASLPQISNCRIVGNFAYYGGGIDLYNQSRARIFNSIIAGNHAVQRGGGISIRNTAVAATSAQIINCTIVGNSADSGGAIACQTFVTATVSNSIIAFNSSGLYVKGASGNAPVFLNNCLFGNKNWRDVVLDTCKAGSVGNSLFTDPLFADVARGNFHLLTNSPCINAGLNSEVATGVKDIDGQDRIQSTTVDIGADEFVSQPVINTVVIHVSQTGNDTADGLSWQSSVATVSEGILRAGVVGGEVWVGKKIYNENIELMPFVNIFGGFSGGETSKAARDRVANASVIDGGGRTMPVVRVVKGLHYSGIDGLTIQNGATTAWVSSGAGIFCEYTSPFIANSIIQTNAAMGTGGGIYINNSKAQITGNRIRQNSALNNGGGIYCKNSPGAVIASNELSRNSAVIGGGICCVGGSASTIISNTIVANTASSKAGGIAIENSSPRIINNIVASNRGGIEKITDSGTVLLTTNCVYQNGTNNYVRLTAGITDLLVDPLFVDTNTFNFHLKTTSPCINAGSSDPLLIAGIDIDGEPRVDVAGAIVDIGADEYSDAHSGIIRAGFLNNATKHLERTEYYDLSGRRLLLQNVTGGRRGSLHSVIRRQMNAAGTQSESQLFFGGN